MKLLTAALGLLLGCGVALAQPKVAIPLAPSSETPLHPKAGAPATAAKKETAPVAPTAPKKAEDKAGKEAPIPPMDGIVVSRGEKGYLGVAVVNGGFVVKFYDDKKKTKTPDVAQIALRWQPRNRNGTERALLESSGTNIFSSTKVVLAPLNFKLYVTLLGPGGADTGENYVVDFMQ